MEPICPNELSKDLSTRGYYKTKYEVSLTYRFVFCTTTVRVGPCLFHYTFFVSLCVFLFHVSYGVNLNLVKVCASI